MTFALNMKLLAQNAERRVWYLRLEPPYETRIPGVRSPFVTIVFACDPEINADEQANISAQLVSRDCRYVLAWGINASSWDDSVDWAFISTDPNFDPPRERHVMTTWHDNETIDDVVSFALMNTNFDSHEFHDYLALMIGNSPEIESEVFASLRRQLVTT